MCSLSLNIQIVHVSSNPAARAKTSSLTMIEKEKTNVDTVLVELLCQLTCKTFFCQKHTPPDPLKEEPSNCSAHYPYSHRLDHGLLQGSLQFLCNAISKTACTFTNVSFKVFFTVCVKFNCVLVFSL